MSKKADKTEPSNLFIFSRDLRLDDNTALNEALKRGPLATCYIFDGKSAAGTCRPALQFLMESLLELASEIEKLGGELAFFIGPRERIIEEILESRKVQSVFVNTGCSTADRDEEKKIKAVCEARSRNFFSFEDSTLHPFADLLKSDQTPYLMFTPFYKNALQLEVKKPLQAKNKSFLKFSGALTLEELKHRFLKESAHHAGLEGGRKKAVKKLASLPSFTDYESARDFPAIKSSRLSPHLSLGTCSVREAYTAILKNLGKNHGLIRSLYWREFFYYLAHFFPHVFQRPFKSEFATLKWSYNENNFDRWCSGETGFPLVDAGMRELNETGFMHNRVRLITASFLVKDLLMDWRMGEEYFAKHLIDYDAAVNNGNWQWCASTGCDSQPFFRIFNPWRQQQRFDAECRYIKRWVPELSDLSPKAIHALERCEDRSVIKGYPAPLVDHDVQAARALRMYEEARGKKRRGS